MSTRCFSFVLVAACIGSLWGGISYAHECFLYNLDIRMWKYHIRFNGVENAVTFVLLLILLIDYQISQNAKSTAEKSKVLDL